MMIFGTEMRSVGRAELRYRSGSGAAGKSRRMNWWRVAITVYVISVCNI
jgi:hypothetical protein